jgi:phosphatidylserine/phosphatidylglycerophosphate/cardiolipin synthase-like enzyme
MALSLRHAAFVLSLAVSSFAFAGCADADPDDDVEQGDESELIEGSAEAVAVLKLVNDVSVTREAIVADAKLGATTAGKIISHRDGADKTPGTADDNPFDNIAELRSKVAASTINKLVNMARLRGLLGSVDVVFSPQTGDGTHLARIAKLIEGAQTSIDIAMYSYSDAKISAALEAATQRGVKVRFIYEVGGDDARLQGDALANSKSGQLEKRGVDVRFINKIMHHKFMIVDGPRDNAAAAKTARISSGSANWSSSAATRYDENTIFATGEAELALKLQREFDTMWKGSKDFVSKPFEPNMSTLEITDAVIPDNPNVDAFFTSANFTLNGTSFKLTGNDAVAGQLVAAIEGAQSSIHIASGHLRSRPVSEALKKKQIENPTMDIRVYLDAQEYISKGGHTAQVSNRAACVERAGDNQTAIDRCNDKGFLFGYEISQAGVDVRYKYYAYRWDHSYAPQMHHKYMVIDGKTLFTGSYNLSDNAEHATFENMLVFRAPQFAGLVQKFEQNFESMWHTGEADGRLARTQQRIAQDASIPLVFDAISLDWNQVTALRASIRAACPAVDSDPFRQNAAAHMSCQR